MAQETMRDREAVMGDAGEAAGEDARGAAEEALVSGVVSGVGEAVVRTAGGAIRNAIAETPHDARGGMPAHRELTLGAKNGGNVEKGAAIVNSRGKGHRVSADGQPDGVCDGGSSTGATLWLDCQSGIAGDMLVAALIDVAEDPAGAERAVREVLASLPVEGFAVEVSRVYKAGIACRDFNVMLDAAHENHDHDMEYLHGSCGEALAARSACDHALHEHAHEHAHEHRGLAEVEALIAAASMTPAARAIALRAFRILASAEAAAHGTTIDQVHFHEVGAVDSIVDIISAAVLFDYLHIERVIVPQLVDGHGTVRCQHGIIPVPVPATLNICRENGLPLGICDVEGEFVTPTGAALVAAVVTGFDLPERSVVCCVGLGAGKRSYSRPSILRALIVEPINGSTGTKSQPCAASGGAEGDPGHATLGEREDERVQLRRPAAPHSDELAAPTSVVKLECDIDDATGEELGYVAELLLEAGAREVHWLPIVTKKGRPAYQLQVICVPEDVARMESVIFRETPTLGIRRVPMERTVLRRRRLTVETPYGSIRCKAAELPDGSTRIAPEYEDCRAAARAFGAPLREVMAAARGAVPL